MNTLLRFCTRTASALAVFLWVLSTAPGARAQGTTACVLAATCTPGRASSPQAAAYNMGILNVTVGNNLINNTTVGQADGYQDYSCTQYTTLMVGHSYALSVRTNANTPENVRVWIDYNNDGTFSASELVFSADNAILHTGTFTPPTTATLGTRLRLRVAADYANGLVPTACSTPQYSQDEDYGVTLTANVNPPTAAFTTPATTTCTGCLPFTDTSQNVPTAWLWTFGDGSTATTQNPSHCYATAGTYAVTLKVSNAAGTSTSAATSIVYNTLVPKPASCSPPTLNYFANYGVVRFRLGTIDNPSADGSAGYQDFTCPQRTELTEGVNYPMTITTGGVNSHDIRVYLDSNNDGVITSSELIFQSMSTATPGASTTLNLPAGSVRDQPLRLRIVADAVGNNPGPCTSPVSGQIEDYTVIVRINNLPPATDFSSNYVSGGCVNPVQFTDLTANLPTAWLWNFGDGGTSTLQNPTHQYAATGTYTVRLAATNAFNTVTKTQPNAVTIAVPCLVYCASNGTGGNGGPNPGGGGPQQPSPFYITNVSVSNAQPAFSNSSTVAAGGYANYTAQPIIAGAGSVLSLAVTSNLAISHRTAVWVDWNMNGVFDTNPSELVANDVTTLATFAASFTVPASFTGHSTRMRVLTMVNTNAPAPCAVNTLNAEVEDYQLQVLPLATRAALALPTLGLYPNPTLDGHLRLRLPDAGAAGLYTTEVQNLLGATVLRTTLRLGPAADAELDLSALAPGSYVLQLRDARGLTALRRVVRE